MISRLIVNLLKIGYSFPMKMFLRFRLFLLIACAALLFTSCGRRLGYSALLWSIPEKNLFSGDVVEVYIKSNISKVYVIGVPKTKEKIEIPLWQILPPVSKSKAAKSYRQMEEYRHIYARVALDGLPVRFEPVNTARQVYRLKKDEKIKVLYKGEGVPVMSGGKPMEGEWLRVLTEDGTQGWCFSYNLRLFDEREAEKTAPAVQQQEDPALDILLQTVWYPEIYASMLKTGRIDLGVVNTKNRFDPGFLSGQITLESGDTSFTAEYKGVTKTGDNVYQFNEAPLTATVKRNDLVTVQFTDAKGMLKSYNFVTLQTPVEEIISTETERRASLIARIAEAAPEFQSLNYGTLAINADGTFTWYGYQLLTPTIIPQNAQGRGTVEMRLFLDTVLTTWYDGVISFKFDGTNKYVNFLYKLENNGLRLEDAAGAVLKGNLLTQRNANALILFFGK